MTIQNMKVVAMIPARLGSKRVPKKNLRNLGGSPLISYVLKSAKKAGVFDEIYLNSEAPVFSEIAKSNGVLFYQRPQHLGSDNTNNDEFLLDFCENVNAEIVIQILPTSPFISPEEIADFVNTMIKQANDTFISVQDHKIACVYQGQGVNFKPDEPHISSQLMVPVQTYATVLMGWKTDVFLQNMRTYGFGYHGVKSKIGYYPLKGFSTIDIDNEEDFRLAESILKYLNSGENETSPTYYKEAL